MSFNLPKASAPVVLLTPRDNIAIACRTLRAGTSIQPAEREVTLSQPVRLGHKVAVTDIRKGDPVIKYGQIIGFARCDIPTGAHVHVHNCEAKDFERDYAYASEVPPPPATTQERTFEGYLRADRRVGTRNYVAVISTVNCSASTI